MMLMLRRRLSVNEDVRSLNDRVMAKLEMIPGLCRKMHTGRRSLLTFTANGGVSSLNLSRYFAPGYEGQILYGSRKPSWVSDDHAMADDFMKIYGAFDLLEGLIQSSMAELIDAFGCYIGMLETNDDQDLADFQKRSLANVRPAPDQRFHVGRIWPVTFIDDLLCHRSFGIGAAEVVKRAAGVCEKAELVAGGAYLHVTSQEVVEPEELNALHTRVMQAVAPGQSDFITSD